MLEDMNGSCSHKSDPSTPCPYLCQSWLNTFPWDKSNARFDKTDILHNFLRTVESISAGDLFDSIDLVYDNELNNIADTVRSSVEDPVSDRKWKERLVEELKNIDSLPTLNDKQFAVFQQLVSEKLIHNINTNKGKVIPNVLIMTPEDDDESLNIKMVYNAQKKKRNVLTPEDLVTMHNALPELKSITIKDLHFKMEKYGDAIVKKNCLESLDIVLSNPVACPSSLLAFLFRSYHNTIKSLKLGMASSVLPQVLPHNREDRGSMIKRVFRENDLNFSKLEALEISNFSNWIDIDTVLRHISKTCHNLKSAKFLGQKNSTSIFNRITENYKHSLESLTVTVRNYEDIRHLSKLTALKELSYLWESLDQKVDILKALMVLPNLTSLELGIEKKQGALVSNVVNLDTYNNLNRISLYNVHIQGDLFENLSSQLPNLKNVALTGCRIGKSGSGLESTISFGNYTLDTLVIEDCRSNNSSKLAKHIKKRNITRFTLAMNSDEPYVATISSSLKDKSKNGKLYIENKFFVYDVGTNDTDSSAPITLMVKANLVRSFSVSRNSPVHVALCLESEIVSDDDSSDEEEAQKTLDVEKVEETDANNAEETEEAEEIEEIEEIEDAEKSEDEKSGNMESVEEGDTVQEDNVADDIDIIGEDDIADEIDIVGGDDIAEVDDIVQEDDIADETDIVQEDDNADETDIIQEDDIDDETDIAIESDVAEKAESMEENKNHGNTTIEVVKVIKEIEVIEVIEIEDDDDTEADELNNQNDTEDHTKDYDEYVDIDTTSLPEVPESPIQDKEASFDEQDSEEDELEEDSSDIVMNEIPSESDSDSEEDEPIVIIKVNTNRDTKKKNISDEEYVSHEEEVITPSSSDDEFDDDMGTRRSARVNSIKAAHRKAESRKRRRALFSSSEESEEEEEEEQEQEVEEVEEEEVEEENESDEEEEQYSDIDYSNLISQFVYSCKRYNAVIRIPERSKRTRFNSPTL